MRITLTPRSRPSPAPAAGRRTGIANANLQAVLDSAPNAAAKGQAQYFTPEHWGQALAQALPAYRPVIVDLTSGHGQLLTACRAPSTSQLLGCDIEALPQTPDARPHPLSADFIHADLTQLATYLDQADWTADCFVLNPPFDLHWYRDRLAFLEASACPAVATAFCRHDGRTSKDTIDSTIATLCLALDRCSPWGEGFIIANHSTIERLIFAPNAPHAALAAHLWARVTIDGNICTPDAKPQTQDPPFQTDVLYFARSHTSGLNQILEFSTNHASGYSTMLAEARARLANLGKLRTSYRAGTVVRQFAGGHTDTTADLWRAIGLEWRTLQGRHRPGDLRWNIWLEADGTIATHLTPFQECQPVKKSQYTRLHALHGRHPMQLILQTADRKELERAVFGNNGSGDSPWRVCPTVTDAVRNALAEYNAVRSPLYPLSQIQRLGYLDENDDILCVQDLAPQTQDPRPQTQDPGPQTQDPGPQTQDPKPQTQDPKPQTQDPKPNFLAGHRYSIRTQTLRVKRTGRKMNLTGELDDVQWEGSELAIYIQDEDGIEQLFMEERLRAPNVRLSIQDEGAPSPIQYNLQQLVEHFEIPEVPDVASQDPAGYQRNLDLLHEIEQIVNA